MKRFRSLFDLKLLCCLVIIAVIFCSFVIAKPCPGQTAADKEVKNRLMVCLSNPIRSLDPTNHRSRDTQIVLKNIFDSLTTRDSSMNVVPQLAESWHVLNDTTWEFKLKQGIKFHNGNDFTAKDIKFTFDRVIKEGAMEGKTSPRQGLFKSLSRIKIIDDYTIHIETEKAWPNLPLMLTLQEILSKKYRDEAGVKKFQAFPVGTGPFKFVRSKEEESVELERFEGYYGGSAQIPPIQTAPVKYLIFRTVSNKIKRIAMLKKGESDIIINIPPETVEILKPLPDIDILSCPATISYFAEINANKPPFDDQKNRLAMNFAMDTKAVVDFILKGHGTVLPTILLPNAFAYNTVLTPYRYDPEMAKKLLSESSFPEERTLAIYTTKENIQFTNIIASFLTRVGIKSTVHITNSWKPDALGKNAKWDIYVDSWGNSTLDPIGILWPKFKTNARGNFSGFSSKEVDTLFLQAETTMDMQLRGTCYKKIQKIVYDAAPMIFGYAAEEFYGVNKRVKNFFPSSSGMMNMHDVYIRE